MPFKTFNNWLFDGQPNSPIPKSRTDENGKVVIPDILKYNSPITHTFVTAMFLKHGPLNHYLNEYFNDIGLRYLSREELFIFIKKCVQDFKIKRSQITFYPRRPRVILYEKLRERLPEFKNDDLELLCDIIEKSDQRDSIYDALGMEKPVKKKIKKDKKMTSTKKSLKSFLTDHFSTIDA